MGQAPFCEPLERRTFLSTAAGTVYSGVYSRNATTLDVLASDLDMANRNSKLGSADAYNVFTADNGGVSTAGETGDDELFGMAGADLFNGGEGADRFAGLSIVDGDQGDSEWDDQPQGQ